MLAQYGYKVPQTSALDRRTEEVIKAFQMHFYPEKIDGQVDRELVRRLKILLSKSGK